MENISDSNITDDILLNKEQELSQLMTLVNLGLSLIAAVIFFGDIFAVAIIRRCTRIPFQTQKLSISFILSDALGSVVFLFHQIVIFIFGISTDLTHNTRIVSLGMLLSIGWFSLAALALDRAIALSSNLRYATLIRRRTVNVTILFIWTFHFISIPSIFAFGLMTVCDMRIDGYCDIWRATKPARVFKIFLLVIVAFIVVGANAYVFRIARRHKRQIADIKNACFTGKRINPISENQFSASQAVFTIGLAFIVLHAPIVIHLVILENSVHVRRHEHRRLFHAFSFICMQINSFISLRLYAGKFKEFKMHAYSFFGRFIKSYAKKSEDLRVDVYNIVVSSELAHKSKPAVLTPS